MWGAAEPQPRGKLRRELRFFEAIAISVGIMAPTAAMALNGTVPGTYSTEAYDAANILLNGILDRNTDRKSLLDYVEGLTTVDEAISKEVVFADNGNIEAQGIFLFEVKDGAIVLKVATDDL